MAATDRIALRLMLHDIRASIRDARRRDLLWVVLGGGPLLAYAIGILIQGAIHRAPLLNESWVWAGAVPAVMLSSGISIGLFFARIAQARAHAPFLRALPLSNAARRRAAAIAAAIFGAPLVLVDAGLVAGLAALIDKPRPLLWLAIALVLAAGAFATTVAVRVRAPYREPVAAAARDGAARRGLSVGWLDRRPAWLGAWAADLPAGRLRLTLRGVAVSVVFALIGLGAVIMSFVHGSAAAGVVAGSVGGLLIFMLVLRCQPLLSPVLRASRLPFVRAWVSLMRMPLTISAIFFGLTALPAYAAAPSAWQVPVAGLMGLLVLNLIYAVFAAFFAATPKLAAFAFFAALSLTFYESLEYSRTIVIGLLALVLFVWHRTRQRYRHG